MRSCRLWPNRFWPTPTLASPFGRPSLAKPTLANTDFGQNRLRPTPTSASPYGRPTLAKTVFGQNRLNRRCPKPTLAKTEFGQIEFVVCCVLCVCVCCVAWVLASRFHGVGFHVWVFKVLVWSCSVLLDRPSRTALHRTPLFPLSRPPFSLFLSLFGSFRGILVVFLKRRDPEMCTFGVLRLSCEAPAARGGDQKQKKKGPQLCFILGLLLLWKINFWSPPRGYLPTRAKHIDKKKGNIYKSNSKTQHNTVKLTKTHQNSTKHSKTQEDTQHFFNPHTDEGKVNLDQKSPLLKTRGTCANLGAALK